MVEHVDLSHYFLYVSSIRKIQTLPYYPLHLLVMVSLAGAETSPEPMRVAGASQYAGWMLLSAAKEDWREKVLA